MRRGPPMARGTMAPRPQDGPASGSIPPPEHNPIALVVVIEQPLLRWIDREVSGTCPGDADALERGSLLEQTAPRRTGDGSSKASPVHRQRRPQELMSGGTQIEPASTM